MWAHETMYTWEDRQHRHMLWRHKRDAGDRASTTRDNKDSCRRLSWGAQGRAITCFTSFLGCPGSGNHMLHVVPGVPRVGQSHASRRSEDVMKCTVTQWCWNGLKEEGHKTPKKFWCAPPLFCGAPPVERAQQKIGWARPRDTSFISSLTMRRAI